MAQKHVLKTQAPYFDAIERGEKNFECRRDDRGFQKGDILVLERVLEFGKGEWIAVWETATKGPRKIEREVTYILTGSQFGIEPGYVVMGLK